MFSLLSQQQTRYSKGLQARCLDVFIAFKCCLDLEHVF